jgi:RimJ/RimL family protein N-acetyltransferase
VKAAQSNSVAFRPTAETDLDFVTAIEQEAAASRFVEAWSRSRHAQTLREPDKLHLVIESVDTAEPVGFMLLAGIGSPDRSIEFKRIVIGPKRRGLGRQAIRLLKRYVFVDLGAHRLWLDVKEFNDHARDLYRSEGFVEEGTLRECVKSAVGYESLVVMSILESEYKPR